MGCENCLKSKRVDSIYDLLDLDEDDRKKLLSYLSEFQLADVANTCNRYPDIYVRTKILDETSQAEQLLVKITLERDWDTSTQGPVPFVIAYRYPVEKIEGWWIVGVDS